MNQQIDKDNLTVHHDADNNRFYVNMADSENAYLEYEKGKDVDWRITSTFTPEALRGHGVASKITEFALDWALERKYKVEPVCPFVKAFILENSQYDVLVPQQNSIH